VVAKQRRSRPARSDKATLSSSYVVRAQANDNSPSTMYIESKRRRNVGETLIYGKERPPAPSSVPRRDSRFFSKTRAACVRIDSTRYPISSGELGRFKRGHFRRSAHLASGDRSSRLRRRHRVLFRPPFFTATSPNAPFYARARKRRKAGARERGRINIFSIES